LVSACQSCVITSSEYYGADQLIKSSINLRYLIKLSAALPIVSQYESCHHAMGIQ
jgi:hypothetical protein